MNGESRIMNRTIKKPSKLITVLIITLVMVISVTAAALNIFHVFGNTDRNWTDASIKILFVGNSHVYTGNVPRQLKTLAGINGVALSYRDISRHGASLDDSREAAVAEMRSGEFDYVVLQDQGRRPVNNIDGFLEEIQILCEEARANGIIPVLYNPGWANIDGRPDTERQEAFSAAYIRAADENGVILVNAGDAWIYAYQQFPEISLYRDFDIRGPHASDAGAFLTACLFASVLFDLRIETIPADNIYTGSDAGNLSQTAWDFASATS